MSALKFLHTSDWHLGKKLFKEERLEEHAHFLQWLLTQGEKNSIDVLLIAGDIFDSPHPPTSALKIYFEFLKEWKKRIPNSSILIIAGNHDSGRFLEAPKQWFEEDKIHLVGQLEQKQIITIKSNYHFHLVPYFRNSELYKEFKKLDDFDESLWEEDEDYPTHLLHQYFKRDINEGVNILLSHHAFGPFSSSPSEQAVTFSGQNSIPISTYKDLFDYVALGHIHKMQKISSTPPAYYSGSPIPFRFSETNEKYILLGECDTSGLQLTPIAIPQLRELHTIEITGDNIAEQLEHAYQELIRIDKEIFLLVKVFMNAPQSGINDLILGKFKNGPVKVLSTQLYFHKRKESKEEGSSQIVLSKDLDTIFKDFYALKTGEQEVPTTLLHEFHDLTQRMNIEKGE